MRTLGLRGGALNRPICITGEIVKMLKMGIISHENFKGKILKAVNEVASLDLEFYLRWYVHESQSVELTLELNHQVDVILYGGPVPYYLANKAAAIMVPADFVSHDEVSLMKALFELQKMGVDLERVSIDTIPESTLRNVCEELQLPFERLKIKPLTEPKVSDDYTTFHMELYNNGTTTFALTCRSIVYDHLVSKQIPCYNMIATKTSIINAINQLNAAYERSKYQGSQIAIGLIKVKSPSLVKESIIHSRRYQIEIHQHLLNYAEKLKAGLTELNEGLYLFYTTYGVLKQVTNGFKEVPDLTALKDLNIVLSIGIGTGNTSSIAEEGARKALLKAEKSGDGHAFIILDNQELLGPLGGHTSRIIVRTISTQLQTMAKESGINVPTMAKLFHLFKNERRYHFTAEELSNELGLSQRSARRILTHLHKEGFAEPIGEEISSGQGRPRRIYRINFASLDVTEERID